MGGGEGGGYAESRSTLKKRVLSLLWKNDYLIPGSNREWSGLAGRRPGHRVGDQEGDGGGHAGDLE